MFSFLVAVTHAGHGKGFPGQQKKSYVGLVAHLLQAVCSVSRPTVVKIYVSCHLCSCELFQLHNCTL